MAAVLPDSLKSADITRFVHRAAQLEKVKPVIWYWSSYYVVNHILEKRLHSSDAESLAYTTKLMDDLEHFKAQNSTNDAVIDDIAGKAYVEQFALDTFSRADNAVRADKATRQTADTFQAAGTFLDLLGVWGPLEPELAAKSKFAKYHALRIAKAIKAGEDPNLSNPKQQPEPEETLPPLDPNDADVQAIEGGLVKPRQPSVVDAPDETDRLQAQLARTSSLDQSLHPSRDASVIRQQQQPSISEVPDEAHTEQSHLARQSSQDESLHPSRAPSLPRSGGEAVSPLASQDAASYYTGNGPSDVSPIEPSTDRKPSIGGNYFPVVPQTQSEQSYQPPAPPSQQAATSAQSPFGLPSAPEDPYLPQAPSTFTSPTQPTINAPTAPVASTFNPEGHFIPPPAPGQPPEIPPNLISQSQPYQSAPQAPPQLRQIPQQPSQPPQQYQHTLSTSSPPPTQYYQAQPTYAPPPQHTATTPTPAHIPNTSAPPVSTNNVVVDEEAMMKAQKHARWAISALNFEDVQTAVRELEGALRVLGAR